MAAGKRELQEINASSMADIAFLLLVFFLVTTTMDTDYGIARKLPPPLEEDMPDPPPIKKRNIFTVLANANDQLLVEGDLMDISELKEAAKVFIKNPQNKADLPEKKRITRADCDRNLQKIKSLIAADPKKEGTLKGDRKKWEKKLSAVELLGDYWQSKQVISLQNDRGTSYNLYITVQDQLALAYRELRDELALEKFGVKTQLLTDDQYQAVKTVYPQKISEAEPVNYQR